MKNKREQFTSPKGRVLFAWLNKPSTKFKPEGEYSVSIILTGEEATKMKADFEARAKAARDELAAAEKDKAKSKKIAGLTLTVPIRPHTDEEGEEIEGEYVVSFKAKASGTRKDGTTWSFAPIVVDSQRNPMKNRSIGRGSIVRVRYELYPYASPGLGKAGISAGLQGVQVIDFQSVGTRDPNSMFDKEDGYVADAESDDAPPTSGGSAEEGSGSKPEADEDIPFLSLIHI